jgi:hypothetical protein
MGTMRLMVELRAVRHAINELRSAIEKHSEAIHAAQKTSNETDKRPKPIPVLVSYDEKTNTSQDRQNTTQDKIALWTRGAVIAAIIYATIAALQWCEMRKATVATEIAANAAVSASRAWMVPVGERKSNPATINFVWKNAGKSPAISVRATAEYATQEIRPAFVMGCDALLKHHGWMTQQSILLENDPFEITLQNMPADYQKMPIPNSPNVVWIHGCVWYTDVLTNRTRTTEFCYTSLKFTPEAVVTPCLETDPFLFK